MLARAVLLGPWLALAVAATASAGPPPPPPVTSDAPPSGSKASPPPPPAPKDAGAGKSGGTSAKPGSVPPAPEGPGAGTSSSDPFDEPERPPVDLSDTWSRSKGGTLQPRYVAGGESRVETPNPEGYYSGVSVEGNHVPPFPAAKMGTKPALFTWTGFERTSAGSRVFFEVSAPVATKLSVKDGTLVLRIVNAKINVKNNTRHLDLRYFRTPVRSVKVKRAGKDIVATIVLKRAAAPKLTLIDGKSGYKLVVLEFADADADAPTKP
jgi:hypothetical protein